MDGHAPAPSLTIPGRFNGPPDSANGGYACGTLAVAMGARAAEVSLRRPPPLDAELRFEPAGDGGALLAGDELVAEGRAIGGVEAEPPMRLGRDRALVASERFPWFDNHIFPSCFVCGPRRPGGDGLELFAGPTGDPDGLHAAPWTPADEWDDGSGAVRSEIVWAALDCPSAMPVMRTDAREAPAMLARLAASVERPVQCGRPHVVVSWLLETDGRKLHSASAICDERGDVLARARALWIELRRPA